MKTKVLSLLSIFFMSASIVFAQAETEKFEVKGNCGMCKTRIEKAAKSIDGVTKADWNQKIHILEVTFDDSKTSVHKIQLAIAEVGHDTPMHKAKDDVYNSLPGCCKYDRTEKIKDTNKQEEHKH